MILSKEAASTAQSYPSSLRSVHEAAIEALRSIADASAVPALVDVLTDESRKTGRRSAAAALGEIGDARAIPALRSIAIKRSSWPENPFFLRLDAMQALRQIGTPDATQAYADVITALVQDADQGDETVRADSTIVLARIGDPLAFDVALVALRDENEIIRRAAAIALWHFRDPSTVPALMQAFNDESVRVRRLIVSALGIIRDPSAIPTLARALNDEDEDVRRFAVGALGSIDHPAAIPALKEVAVHDKPWPIPYDAIDALKEMDSPEAEQALSEVGLALIEQLKPDDRAARIRAEDLLIRLRSTSTVPLLIQLFNYEDIDVQERAARILQRIGTREALAAVEIWEAKWEGR